MCVKLIYKWQKDGKFIVMHDLNLNRLSGVNKEVSHMNFDEALKIEQNGFVDKMNTITWWSNSGS